MLATYQWLDYSDRSLQFSFVIFFTHTRAQGVCESRLGVLASWGHPMLPSLFFLAIWVCQPRVEASSSLQAVGLAPAI